MGSNAGKLRKATEGLTYEEKLLVYRLIQQILASR